ncbi:MAG: hypothetical protein OHK0018_12960 [Erythrobacter tepidarius]
MDFMKLLKSLEELLYEVMVMLVFFPRTLFLTIRHPQRMMDYADTELGDVQSEQYSDTLSPPLILSLRLMSKLGIALDRETLRPVFYSQCFVTAPMALAIGVATVFWQVGGEITVRIGQLTIFGTLVWYIAQQTLWFRSKLGVGLGLAAVNAVGTTLVATLLIMVTALTMGFVLAREIAT